MFWYEDYTRKNDTKAHEKHHIISHTKQISSEQRMNHVITEK